jgi:predicted site-specific integrase-resolvase
MSNDLFLSKSEVARIAGVTRPMVYRWIDAGLLPLDERGRIRKHDLNRMLAEHSSDHPEQFIAA